MLSQFRKRVYEAFEPCSRLVLATDGPAGLQVSLCPCTASQGSLYVRVLRTSEHLTNLQQEPLVVTLTPTWRMRSRAVLIGDGEGVNLVLERQPWETLVCLQPITFEFVGPDGITPSETIDLDYGPDLSGPSSGNDPA